MGPISRLFYLCLTIAMITNLFSSNKYIKWGVENPGSDDPLDQVELTP